jgi:putative PEP-CTERM system TPR-repeat lipoprotein
MKISGLIKITSILLIIVFAGCGKQTSNQYFQEAQQHILEDNPASAIVALKNALQLEPQLASARFELGRLYMLERQFENAEKELDRALSFGFAAAQVLPLLTQAYQRTGAYSALSKLDHQAAGLTTDETAEMGYFKVLALGRLNQLEQAGDLISQLQNVQTDSLFKRLTAAYQFVLNSQYATAKDAVAKIRVEFPDNAEVLKLLGQLNLSLNMPKEAVDIFSDYVGYYPLDNQMTFVLAKLLVDTGQVKRSEFYVDQLLNISPLNPLLNELKAAARAAHNDFINTSKHAEAAINAGATGSSLRLMAGYSAYEQGNYEGANRHLSLVASELPNNHPGLKLLAASQLALGLTDEVGDVLARLDDLSEKDAPLLSRASYQLLRDGYEKDARKLVEKSVSISNTAEELTRLGLLQLSLNNLQGIVNLEQAMAIAPQLENAQSTLAKAYLATQQYTKALSLSAKWKKNSPDDVQPYMLAGDVLMRQKQYELAQQEFQQAQSQDPQNPIPKLALVNLQLAQGNVLQGEFQLTELLVNYPSFIPALATSFLLDKQKGQVELGLQKIWTAHNNHPENIRLRLLLARSLLVEQQYQQSIEVLAPLESSEDVPSEYWKVMGQSLIRSNQKERATVHHDRWLNQQPHNKDATIGKLLLLDSENKFSQALTLTQAFLDKRDDPQVGLLRLHFLLMDRQYAQAKQVYADLSSNLLDLPLVKGFLARLQLADDQPKLALPNAKVAYQTRPSERNLVVLVVSLERLKLHTQALATIQQHVATRPNDMAARMLLAERQISLDVSQAMASYETALQQNPDNYVANNNLAYLYLQQGQLAKAKQFANNAVTLQPRNAAALDTLAQVWVAEKNYRKALDLYDLAASTETLNEEIYLNYIEALLAADRRVIARRKIQQRPLTEPNSQQRLTELKAQYQIE